MSILNTIFGNGNQQQPAPQPAPQQPNPAPEGAAANPTIPNDANTPHQTGEQGEQIQSPLDNYKDLWDNFGKQGDDGAMLTFDRDKLGEIANKMNFANSINDEQLQSINAGGEQATKAMLEIMNTIARNAYMNSTETTTHLLNNALKNSKEDIFSKLPEHIKRMNVSDSLTKENPMFNNPAVKPILSALETQLTAKYPNASADEITNHAKQYLSSLAGVFNPESNKPKQPSVPAEQDFSSFLS